MFFSNFYFNILNESAYNMENKTPAKQPVQVYIGRFQPFSLGHYKVLEKMAKENPKIPIMVLVVKGALTSKYKNINPLPFRIQKQLIFKSAKNILKTPNSIQEVPTGYIPFIIDNFRAKGLEIIFVIAGPDRYTEYIKQIKSIPKSAKVNVKIIPLYERYTTKEGESISGTSVRNAIKTNNFKYFQQLTTGYSQADFNLLRKYIK